jgi:hypothetical protein
MTLTHYASLAEATAHLAVLLGHQETVLDPDFDPALDDLEREFAELRMTAAKA